MGASRLPVGDEPVAFKNVEDVLSYREENGQVVLTMSRGDYVGLMTVFAAALKLSQTRPKECLFGDVFLLPDQIIALGGRLQKEDRKP